MITGHIFKKTEQTENASFPYREYIRSILYSSINTRPDLNATGILGRFASKFDVKAIEKLFGYLNTIKNYGLVFTHCENHIVEIKI